MYPYYSSQTRHGFRSSIAEKVSILVRADIVMIEMESGRQLSVLDGSMDESVRIDRTDLREIVQGLSYKIAVPMILRGKNYYVFGHLNPGLGMCEVASLRLRKMERLSALTAQAMPGTSFLIKGEDNIVAPAILIPTS